MHLRPAPRRLFLFPCQTTTTIIITLLIILISGLLFIIILRLSIPSKNPITSNNKNNNEDFLVIAGKQWKSSTPTQSPTSKDITRYWHLRPPQTEFIDYPGYKLFQTPFCKSRTTLSRQLCSSWLDSMTEYQKRRTQIRFRRRDELNQWREHQHPKCPSISSSSDNPQQPSLSSLVQIYVRDWKPDWNHVYYRIINTDNCPQQCAVVTQYTSNVAIVLDTNSLLEIPKDPTAAEEFNQDVPPIRALLEMQNNLYHYGQMVRDRDLEQTDILVSYSRGADVWVNYMYGWEECANGKEDLRLEKGSFLNHFDKCLPKPPTLHDLMNKNSDYGSRDFVGAFISGFCDLNEPTPNDPPGRLRAQYLKELLDALERRVILDQQQQQQQTSRTNNNIRNVVNYGSCHPRKGSSSSAPKFFGNIHQRVEALKSFKFSLAFESEWRLDYITEQMYQSVIAGTVPVVFAGPEIIEHLPGGKGSYISVLDFPNPDALAKFLVELDNDHARYLTYFDWRWDERKANWRFPISNGFSFVGTGRESLMCRICSVFVKEYCMVGNQINDVMV
jgi:hypothetical protein